MPADTNTIRRRIGIAVGVTTTTTITTTATTSTIKMSDKGSKGSLKRILILVLNLSVKNLSISDDLIVVKIMFYLKKPFI